MAQVKDVVCGMMVDSETAILAPKATDPGAEIRIQTGKKILGKPRSISPARRT